MEARFRRLTVLIAVMAFVGFGGYSAYHYHLSASNQRAVSTVYGTISDSIAHCERMPESSLCPGIPGLREDLERLADMRDRNSETATNALVAALGIPSVLLVLFFGLRWVFAGQIRAQSKSVPSTELSHDNELRLSRTQESMPPATQPVTDSSSLRSNYRPLLLPIFFAFIAAATLGRELGGALAGPIGAGLLAVALWFFGWWAGKSIAVFARRRKHLIVRGLLLTGALIAWVYLNGVGMMLAKFFRGTLA
jgi:hypothetical protein